jgi:acetyl-CoA carboxylase carboxyltransferase component
LKRYNKFEITIALSSLVIAIPLFIFANEINFYQKILTGIGIIVIVIIVKSWDTLRGRKVKKVLGDPSDYEGKVQVYKSRNNIQLEDIILEAKKEIIILSITNFNN